MAGLEDRKRGAIWGALLGDAYCLGSHWIYDDAVMAERFPDGVQGFDAPVEGHYHHPKVSGDFTHYGDMSLLFLESVAGQGRFDHLDYGRRLVRQLGSADYVAYRDRPSKALLADYEAFCAANPDTAYGFQDGADDEQPLTTTRMAPLVVAHLDDSDIDPIIERATRVCQNNARAVAYAIAHGHILKSLIHGDGLNDAFAAAVSALRRHGDDFPDEIEGKIADAVSVRHLPVTEAVNGFGKACRLVLSFPGAVHAALTHANDPAAAIAACANAGGDSAARAAMCGAWLGALHGLSAFPADWPERVNAGRRIERAVGRLVPAG